MTLIRQVGQFLGVGAFMTLLGYVAIVTLTEVFGIRPVAANFAAYLVLLVLSYWLHSRFTFRRKSTAPGLVRYFGSFGVSYLANVLVLVVLVDRVHHAIAQLIAISVYAIMHFVISKKFIFSA